MDSGKMDEATAFLLNRCGVLIADCVLFSLKEPVNFSHVQAFFERKEGLELGREHGHLIVGSHNKKEVVRFYVIENKCTCVMLHETGKNKEFLNEFIPEVFALMPKGTHEKVDAGLVKLMAELIKGSDGNICAGGSFLLFEKNQIPFHAVLAYFKNKKEYLLNFGTVNKNTAYISYKRLDFLTVHVINGECHFIVLHNARKHAETLKEFFNALIAYANTRAK